MKRIYLSSLLAFFAFLMFTSCQKEVNSIDVTNPIVSVDSNYLDKIYYLYDNGSGIDTQVISVCRYDNLKRLTSITDSVFDDDNGNHTYYYNNTDTLPYKSMYTADFSLGSDTEIVYHYFDANQNKSKDSIIRISYGGSTDVQVVNYSYAPGKMYGEIIETGVSPLSAPVYSRDTATLDANNNIVHNVDYRLSGADYILNGTSDFTYDNHPNRFSRLNVFKSFNRFPNGETLFWEIMCINNIIIQHEAILPPNQFNFNPTFVYTYGQNGYPVTNIIDYGSHEETEIYSYRHL